MRRIVLEPGTSVVFEGSSMVYELQYPQLLECETGCTCGHCDGKGDREPYIAVYERTGKAFPLSKLRLVGEPNSYRLRPITPDDIFGEG